MQQTANYGFLKPEDNESFDQQLHANANMDSIDAELKAQSDAAAAAGIAAAAAVQQDVDEHKAETVHIPYAATAGAANAYTVTLDPVPTVYNEGMAVAVKINIDNTGASTIDVNGLGAKAIKKPNGNDVSAGNLKADSVYTLRYNGVNFILQGEGGGGTAQPGEVLAGETFTNDSGEQTGTMPNQGQKILTPGVNNIAIPAGYHDGTGYVIGDADLVAANIKSGANIYGVAGNANVVDTSPGTAVAGDILAGKVAFVDGAQLTGTMTNRGAYNITPGVNNIAIPAGYHNGSGVVYGVLGINVGTVLYIMGKRIPMETGAAYGTYTIGYNDTDGSDTVLSIFVDAYWATVVTSSPIDLTNVSRIIALVKSSNGIGTTYLIASTSKTGDYQTYNARAVISPTPSDFYRVLVLDVSTLSGNHYIRLHYNIQATGNTGTLYCKSLLMG